ncbi:hypothetical protein SUGI_0740520 [Cryptomeria japonica]|uniref:uncharacterized protein LOC131065714 n=1 Tax=Cryptomeria japonica TaxID=3369 RepID=UPI0024149089|nr:uncharacterized protein LOC131065714 [Cryptomeria japonica]XP_057856291.2 uncharacterized protein LOC131065714 [Cryptomeria japonica]XP_057856293.2 uncharacterized protein LOC131065714 [Cryptomeria japonica]XP_057856294.2 uncharacterized protein LOC131065714 [Cryptomeria japonica]GLJ36764.1 hypothetical protein SUGI_0740520 [Cryptomeria japonica]
MLLFGSTKSSGFSMKPQESMKLTFAIVCGIFIGFFIGILFSSILYSQFDFLSRTLPITFGLSSQKVNDTDIVCKRLMDAHERSLSAPNGNSMRKISLYNNKSKIFVESNPHGAETLPPGIVVRETDLYPRRLWGKPSEDLPFKPKYLVAFTVGIRQKYIVNDMVSKFSEKFSVILFHYDGITTEWDQFEWSRHAIHVSTKKQTKWWFAKRFLHPDIVAPYEYIFIWDEDLGLEHFDAEKYLELVRKHSLEISQPGLKPNNALVWNMTKRRTDVEVHTNAEERPGLCRDPQLPPCAGFVEIMAPVFSRKAWRCVWHMIQNDLVHGWGLDLSLQRCAEPAHEKIGVVDAQWIEHKNVPSLGSQGESSEGKSPWQVVRDRCFYEMRKFQIRMDKAEKDYRQNVELRN